MLTSGTEKCNQVIGRLKKKRLLKKRKEKGYQLVVDTRLITPYTSYLLRGFEYKKYKVLD